MRPNLDRKTTEDQTTKNKIGCEDEVEDEVETPEEFMEYYAIELIIGEGWCDLEFPFPIQEFWPALARTKAAELARLAGSGRQV